MIKGLNRNIIASSYQRKAEFCLMQKIICNSRNTIEADTSLAKERGRVAIVDVARYEEQLTEKLKHVESIFSDVHLPQIEIFASPKEHYRLRADFEIFHAGDKCYYVMFEGNPDEKAKRLMRVRKDNFPAASLLINELMTMLLEEIHKSEVLKKKLFSVNFHTMLKGEAMITLVYHKKLGEEWQNATRPLGFILAQALSCTSEKVNIIGRSKKIKIVLDDDFVTENLCVNGKTYSYKQMEACFSQPNGSVCEHMLSWAQRVTKSQNNEGKVESDFLELYCGNGNFTIPLAENFRRVIATEVSKTSTKAALENLDINSVKNILIARMSSEEFSQKWADGGDLGTRLQHIKKQDLNIKTILVDPPRAGVDSQTIKLMKEFDNIVYISCNPSTLHLNLQEILKSHKISNFAVFDQFPYTGHLECGVYLKK